MAEEFKFKKGDFEDNTFSRGIFTVPHGILDVTVDVTGGRFLSKTAVILLIVLLHFENRKTKSPNEWFECDDRDFYRTKLITRDTLVAGRSCLENRCFLDVEVGNKHKATRYRIRIPGEYYYKQSFRGSKRNHESARAA